MNILNALANDVSSMLAEYFEDEDFSDLWEEEEEDDEEEEEEDEEIQELKDLAELASQQSDFFKPEDTPEPEEEEEEPDPENNVPPLWNNYQNQKLKRSKRVRYLIINFGEDESNLMSRVDDSEDFTVLINEGNPKFISLKSESTPFLLALHISELLIREITMYKNPFASPSDLDESISKFYSDKYSQLKDRSS